MTELVYETNTGTIVAEVATPLEVQNIPALRIICKAVGITGYGSMTKAQIIAAINQKRNRPIAQVEEATPVVEVVPPKAKAKPVWADHFIDELQSLCVNLDEMEPNNFLPEEILQVVTRVKEGEIVDAFDDLSDDQIVSMISLLRNQLPKYQREVYEVIRQIANARAIAVEIDFI